MKKFYSIITFVFMAMAAATLTGCDEDSNIAYTIEGIWEGNMYKQGYYDGRYYQSSRTVMQFDRDPYRYTSGAGRWIDYYSDAPMGLLRKLHHMESLRRNHHHILTEGRTDILHR